MPATTPRPPSSEQVAAFDRNAWPRSIGIPGRNRRNPHRSHTTPTAIGYPHKASGDDGCGGGSSLRAWERGGVVAACGGGTAAGQADHRFPKPKVVCSSQAGTAKYFKYLT